MNEGDPNDDSKDRTFVEVLAIFWESHNPGFRSWSRQYMTAIFFHNNQQKKLALETKDQVAARIKDEAYTQILPATEFYLAEDYHQKHFLRREPKLLNELTAIYPTTMDFLASTVAAR